MLKSVKKRHLWLYIIAVVASLGGLLSGFDTGVISGALIFINETWSMTPLEQGWVILQVSLMKIKIGRAHV